MISRIHPRRQLIGRIRPGRLLGSKCGRRYGGLGRESLALELGPGNLGPEVRPVVRGGTFGPELRRGDLGAEVGDRVRPEVLPAPGVLRSGVIGPCVLRRCLFRRCDFRTGGMVLDHALLPESIAAVAGVARADPGGATIRPDTVRPASRDAVRLSAGSWFPQPITSLSTQLSTVVNDGWSRLVTDRGVWDLWCEGLTLTSSHRLLQAVIHRL